MKNAFPGVILVGFIIIAVMFVVQSEDIRRSRRANADEVKKIREIVDLGKKSDSLKTITEGKRLDSAKQVKRELDSLLQQVQNENTLIRRQNSALEKKFRDIVLADRPDF